MNILKKQWHWGVTILWLALIILLWFCPTFTHPTELNGVGDFLAGAFAPLAFFWLIRGFYQQGEGLKQNSDALHLQAEELKVSSQAMLAQVEEMKASVEQQKLVVNHQEIERQERHNLAKPILKLEPSITKIGEERTSITFAIFNLSPDKVRIIYLNCSNAHDDTVGFNKEIIFNKDHVGVYQRSMTESEKRIWKSKGHFVINLRLSYENIYGHRMLDIYQILFDNSDDQPRVSILSENGKQKVRPPAPPMAPTPPMAIPLPPTRNL